MEQIENIELAALIVKQGADEEERRILINKLLEGEPDTTTEEGKALLSRRAHLMTELRVRRIYDPILDIYE